MTYPPSGRLPTQNPGGNGQPVDIRQYGPRRSPEALLWVLVVALTGVGIILGGLYARFGAAPQPTPTPSAPTHTAPAGPGLPFEMPNDPRSTGRWEIIDQVWENGGVSLQIRIYADTGNISYGFAAFPNKGEQSFVPLPGTRMPELDSGALSAGESVTGWVFLPLPRGDATILLTSSRGMQMSALGIKG